MSTDKRIVNPPYAWKCCCGCNNRPPQVDCYSCGKPRTERAWHDPDCRCEFCKSKPADEPAGVPQAVAERDVLGDLTPAQYRAHIFGTSASEPAGAVEIVQDKAGAVKTVLVDGVQVWPIESTAEPAGDPPDVVSVPRDTLNRALTLITFVVHEHGGDSYGQEQPGWEGATLLMEELEAAAEPPAS